MGQSLSKIIAHIVFSTKYRKHTISQIHQDKLHTYVAALFRKRKSEAFRIGGTSNHIHIACTLPRTMTVAKLIEEIKIASSVWMKDMVSEFHWQDGYGVFSISESQLPKLIRYIENQHEHHGDISYEDELRNICDHYGVQYDEEYLLG